MELLTGFVVTKRPMNCREGAGQGRRGGWVELHWQGCGQMSSVAVERGCR